jgi:hypothetical protein
MKSIKALDVQAQREGLASPSIDYRKHLQTNRLEKMKPAATQSPFI